jgi:hypothetical protein
VSLSRPLQIAACALALALPLAASAQTKSATAASAAPAVPVTEVAGVKFDNEINLRGSKLVLNGAGVRYKVVFKVYAAGLYVPAKVNTPEAVYDTKGARSLRVVMLRDIDANELGKLFTQGMEKNATREEFAKAIPGTIKLGEIFATKNKLTSGESFTIDYLPGVGTAITVDGKPTGEVIKEPEFFSALMKIWLGKSPADSLLKDALLGNSRN